MLSAKLKERAVKKSLSLKKTKNMKENGNARATADISKYFQKTKSSDDEKDNNPVSSLRDPETQPLAKRQRNELPSSENKTPFLPEHSNFQTCKNINECLVSGLEFASKTIPFCPSIKNPLEENSVNSICFTTIKTTTQVASNSSDINATYICDSKNKLQCLEKVNGVETLERQFSRTCENGTEILHTGNNETLSKNDTDLCDDFIIPPTPSPVEHSKNTSRISLRKNGRTPQSAGQLPNKVLRNYKHIKKPSKSALSRNLNHSKFITKPSQNSKCNEKSHISETIKENLLSENKIDPKDNNVNDSNVGEDLISWSDKINIPNAVGKDYNDGYTKSLRSSSLKLSKKTFKLCKKPKKNETGKAVTNKKLEHGDAGYENDILSGYDTQGKIVGNGLPSNVEDVDGISDPSRLRVKTRRKLSLDRPKLKGKNLHEETQKSTDHKQQSKPATDNIPPEDDMADLEKTLVESNEGNFQEMFDMSLNNDEMCQLMDDNISWSPMDIKTSKQRQYVGFSPAKQYVRSKSTELNTLTANIAVQDNETTFPSTDSPKRGYRRFLVLEVYRRESLDHTSTTNAGVEKVLRLFDESDNSEKYCQLRGEWERTEVEHGDIVNIVGKQSESGSYLLNNGEENYIVVYPDILVTPTSISTSTKCLRRSILDKYFKTEGPSQVMFLGTLLHRIFEASLMAKDFSAKFVLNHARQLLQEPSNLTELYGLGITEDEVSTKVSEFTPFLAEWGTKYFVAEPHPIHGAIDFKEGGASKSMGDSRVALCVSQVLDIEECVWSPKFGLKGQIDSSVEVKINRNPNIMKKNSSLNQTCVLPLELKTGKCYTKLGSVEHRAQVILYTLMMMERYDRTLDTGLLLYLKTAHMLGVPAHKHEKRALVMKRNELVRYLSHAGTKLVQSMPGMLRDEHNCKYCPQLNVCTMYHRSVEKGDCKSAGMGNLFDKSTSHLSPVHLKYFSYWNELIALESKAMQENASDCDIWCLSGTEREQLGYCFSKMFLVSCCAAEEPGRYLNKFRKEDLKSSQICAADMHFAKGDYIVVSQEDGVMALATGFLKEICEESISVLLDKDLTRCYHHRRCSENQLYRIDKAEISTGATIQWSNLAKLFFADSEEHAKLRRLIVDLQSPKFSRENEMISSISSSQVSGAWSSQLSSCSMTSPMKSSQGDNELTQILQDLNSDQRKAIRKVLTAEDYALILGCPGAGKTHTIACLVRALVSLGKSVLLTSYTHSAVDNILLKLKQSQVDFLRLGSVQKIHPDIQPYAIFHAAKHIKTVKELKDFYESKLVVATTCLGVNNAIFNQRSFDYCIVDEASQITQPVCIGSLRHASIFVLVGDHYQLPPLVQSHKARENGMDISLFKRLSECHPHAVVHLEYQYRMHKHIMLLSNTLIYENRLKCATQEISEKLIELPNFDKLQTHISQLEDSQKAQFSWLLEALNHEFPVLFIDTDSLSATEVRSGHNVFNEIEAALVATITHGFIKSGLKCEDIGVISPYRQQLKAIKQHLNVEGDNVQSTGTQLNVEINTVDKYQGRDKLCVIVSLVRSNAGGHVGDLLRDWRRVNVAVTRAKRKLILLGSKKTLNHNMLFQELLSLLEKNSWIFTLHPSVWRGLLPW